MRLLAHILAVLALLGAAFAGTATAATTTADPAPQELWRAYPLQPGQSTPSVRLPASSATLRPPPATAAARNPGTTNDGGASPGWLLVVAIGAVTLLLGLLAGRRARRPQPAQTAAATPAVAPPVPAPRRRRAEPRATPPAPPATPPRPRATPPRPRAAPPRRETPPAPSTPPPTASHAPRAMPPKPRAMPPEPPEPVMPPPTAPPGAVVGPELRRFRRVPWPTWSQALWRCEITYHYGVLHADLRVMAHEPGQNRGTEVLRTGSHTRPGWGADPPAAELTAIVRRLGDALLATGWEPVRGADDEATRRFIWPREGRPPLDRLAVEAATDKEDGHDE